MLAEWRSRISPLVRFGTSTWTYPGWHGLVYIFDLGFDLRDAIESGAVLGPRISTGAHALLTSVGGTAGRLFPDEGERGYARIVGTCDEIVREVRRQIKAGVDWIKVHATGLYPRQREQGEIQVWSLDELRTVVGAAHDLGVPVVAHCRNSSSTRDCAIAGVDLILHPTFMQEVALEALIARKVPLAPTLTFQANLADHGAKVGSDPALMELFRAGIPASAGALRRASDAGVPLLSGSESGFSLTPYGHWHWREMEVFVKHLGLSPREAIRTATANGAIAMRKAGPNRSGPRGWRRSPSTAGARQTSGSRSRRSSASAAGRSCSRTAAPRDATCSSAIAW